MEEDKIVLQENMYGFGGGGVMYNPANIYGYQNPYGGITGSALNEQERTLLSGTEWDYSRKRGAVSAFFSGKRRRYESDLSKDVSLRGVSMEDYNRILDVNLFSGDDPLDVSSIELTDSVYKRNQATGQTARVSGDALSSLDEADLEQIASVFEARRGQIMNSSLSPGLESQSFSLLG